MAQGWIKLHRQIKDCELWQDVEPFDRRSAWVDLILAANHDDKDVILGNELISIQRGSFITSIRKLCDKWKWSNTKVVAFLKLLQKTKMILYFSDTKKTLITIENYNLYQSTDVTETTQKRHENDTETTQKHTNKNDKECYKNDNKDILGDKPQTNKFIPPDLKDVQDYCIERNKGIDAETFINFYASKGWMIGKNKMKDWKAAIRTWERGNKNSGAMGDNNKSNTGKYSGFKAQQPKQLSDEDRRRAEAEGML